MEAQYYINPAVYQKFRRDLVKSLGIVEDEVADIPISHSVQAPAQPRITATLVASAAPGQPKSAVARALILSGYQNKSTPKLIIEQIIAETAMPHAQAKNYFKNGCKQLNIPASFYS